MKTDKTRKHRYFLSMLLIAALLTGLMSACDGISDTNDPLPPYTFIIYPIIDTREVLIEKNWSIGGLLINSSRDSLSGYRVDFWLTPDTMGTITPIAHLEKDSSSGFREEVTFFGMREGIVLITGRINKADGSFMVQDTLCLKVHNPVNG